MPQRISDFPNLTEQICRTAYPSQMVTLSLVILVMSPWCSPGLTDVLGSRQEEPGTELGAFSLIPPSSKEQQPLLTSSSDLKISRFVCPSKRQTTACLAFPLKQKHLCDNKTLTMNQQGSDRVLKGSHLSWQVWDEMMGLKTAQS